MTKSLALLNTQEGSFEKSVRDRINSNIPDVAIASAQTSVTSSTTLVNASGLVTDDLEPGTYKVNGFIILTSGASGGVKAALKQSVANMLTSLNVNRVLLASGGSASATFTSTTDAASLAASTAAYVGLLFEGIIVVRAKGNLQFQIAQNASDATATTVELGSFIEFQRIA